MICSLGGCGYVNASILTYQNLTCTCTGPDRHAHDAALDWAICKPLDRAFICSNAASHDGVCFERLWLHECIDLYNSQSI